MRYVTGMTIQWRAEWAAQWHMILACHRSGAAWDASGSFERPAEAKLHDDTASMFCDYAFGPARIEYDAESDSYYQTEESPCT